MLNLAIKSGIKNYQVNFIDNLKEQIIKLNQKYTTHFLIDKNIWKIFKKELTIKKNIGSILLFDAREKNKTLKEVHKYVEFLLEKKVQKKHKIIVIGGGLVQDIGSFTAHIIKRGIDWVFIPTTLLSMSDSCIGGKSGINVGKHKNQVGTFHPPIEIYIYSNFIKTLPPEELINGIGEIIKHALIKGGLFFNRLKTDLIKIQKNSIIAQEIIYQSLLIKKEIVEEDELDTGIRKLLNYGHTFGHALEGDTKNKIPHGLGVLIGIDMANFISMKRRMLSQLHFEDIHKFIKNYIPVKKIGISDFDSYMTFLSKDKKVVGKDVYAILSSGIGKIKVVPVHLDEKLKQEIKNYCSYFES